MKPIYKTPRVSVFSNGCHVEKRFQNVVNYENERDILLELQELKMVIHVHDYDDKRKTLTLEYIPHSLEDVISKKCFSTSQKLGILTQLVDFLVTIHSVHGVCHNDLKSKNILIAEDFSSIYVIDFDMASWSKNNIKDIKMFKFIYVQIVFDISYIDSHTKFDAYYDRIVNTSILDSTDITDIQKIITKQKAEILEIW